MVCHLPLMLVTSIVDGLSSASHASDQYSGGIYQMACHLPLMLVTSIVEGYFR